jgi:ABC-type lipoprotein export system ATPase subunit
MSLIIMGDQPTGNLDKKDSDLVFDIFKKIDFRKQTNFAYCNPRQRFCPKNQ